MAKFIVARRSNQLRSDSLKLGSTICISNDFSRTHKREVQRVKEKNNIFPLKTPKNGVSYKTWAVKA
jgi:hypothetical protein